MKEPKKLDSVLLQKGDLFRGKYRRYGMKKPKKLDPALLQKGDLFRGKYWRYGMNHVFKETHQISDNEMVVISLCSKWFDPFELHEPNEDTKFNNCLRCDVRREKENGI